MSRSTREFPRVTSTFGYGAVTRYGRPSQIVLLASMNPTLGSHNPVRLPRRFGLVRVRSPLLAESRLISFPPGTEMFHFPGLAPNTYGFSAG